MSTNLWLILLSSILIISFIFNHIQRKYQISAVILLLLTGVILQLGVKHFALSIALPDEALKVFGTLGLLVIVLEAVMDMEVTQNNSKLFIRAMIFASLIVFASIGLISFAFMRSYNITMIQALIYATPLAIVSSAIVIPTVSNLNGQLKDFLVLESVFSDIIGVLAFNFIATVEFTKLSSISMFIADFMLMIVISVVTTIILGIMMSKEKSKNIHVMILAVLILIYAATKVFHLSALVLILIFGISLRNLSRITAHNYGKHLLNYFDHNKIKQNIHSMQEFIEELGFIIRSIFFILLGYSINLQSLLSMNVLLNGIMIAIAIYAVRFVFLQWIIPTKELLVATTMAPRGLITVLLFFQIPGSLQYANFNGAITFIVVIISGIIMSGGLIIAHKKE